MLLESEIRWPELDDRLVIATRDIERAIGKTRHLLMSKAAKDNPELASKWQLRLQRQERNLEAICGKLLR